MWEKFQISFKHKEYLTVTSISSLQMNPDVLGFNHNDTT